MGTNEPTITVDNLEFDTKDVIRAIIAARDEKPYNGSIYSVENVTRSNDTIVYGDSFGDMDGVILDTRRQHRTGTVYLKSVLEDAKKQVDLDEMRMEIEERNDRGVPLSNYVDE